MTNQMTIVNSIDVKHIPARDRTCKTNFTTEVVFNKLYPYTVLNKGSYVVSSCESIEGAQEVINSYNN